MHMYCMYDPLPLTSVRGDGKADSDRVLPAFHFDWQSAICWNELDPWYHQSVP